MNDIACAAVEGKSTNESNDDRNAHNEEVVITTVEMAKIIVFTLAIINVVTMMTMLTAPSDATAQGSHDAEAEDLDHKGQHVIFQRGSLSNMSFPLSPRQAFIFRFQARVCFSVFANTLNVSHAECQAEKHMFDKLFFCKIGCRPV